MMLEKRSKKVWFVEPVSNREYYGPRPWRSAEDGFVYYDWPEGWSVLIRNEYGLEYASCQESGRELTEKQACKWAADICEFFEKGGQPDLKYFGPPRVVYGTQAYLDEEPYIAEREKSDALTDYGGWDGIPIKMPVGIDNDDLPF